MSDENQGTDVPILRPTPESVNARVLAFDTQVHGDKLTTVTLLLDNGHMLSAEANYVGKPGGFDAQKASQTAFNNALQKLYDLEIYLWTERCWQAAGCPSQLPNDPANDAPKIIVPGEVPMTLVKP